MSKVMVTLKLDPEHASLEEVRESLGIGTEEIDDEFGVIAVSPEESLYAVLVEPETANRVQGVEGVKGPFSNPKIEPFGPPQSADR
jgi:hypothetical protein